MTILNAIREWWTSMTITPEEAQQCANGLRALQEDVHARFNSLETPQQAIARIEAGARQTHR